MTIRLPAEELLTVIRITSAEQRAAADARRVTDRVRPMTPEVLQTPQRPRVGHPARPIGEWSPAPWSPAP